MKIKNGDELLEKFAKKLVLDKGKIFKAEEKRAEVERILEEVNEEMLDKIIAKLPDEKIDRLDELTSGESLEQDELEAVMNEAGVDYEKIMMDVLGDYRDRYLKEEM